MKKHILIAIMALAAGLSAVAGRKVTYARNNQAVVLDLQWGNDNYGTVQWQKSTDNGLSWTDIAGANATTYTFKMTGNALYRALIEGDKACPVIAEECEVRNVMFTASMKNVGAYSAEMRITGTDFADAEIVEYGWCYNISSLQRDYRLMPRVKMGSSLPDVSEFSMMCEGLRPAQSYSLRPYFITAEGAMMFGPARTFTTLAGPDWRSENWKISKNSITSQFEIAGYANDVDADVRFYIGKNATSMRECAVTSLGNNRYSAEAVGLEPNTEYTARVTVAMSGATTSIEKTVRTFSDYSSLTVDNTVKPVGHAIEWDPERKLVQLSPEGHQVEYPRMCRVDDHTILLSYHGGDPDKWWEKVYLRKSTDNGTSWSTPVLVFDAASTQFGVNYKRLMNPELLRLQNGWILLTCIGNGEPETNDNCHVLACISKDGGDTWGDPIIVGRGRSWEPQVVQLPNGELELLVSSEAAWFGKQSTLYQEILCSRSTDNGLTWTEFTRASYNPARRDGMPVAIVQQGNKGVLFIIESIWDSLSPVMIHRNLDEEWEQAEWDRVEDSRRWSTPMRSAGAPYCLQLPTGEIVITAYCDLTGSVWQTARPRVYIGDNTGHNFTFGTVPLSGSSPLPKGTGAYCCSLFLKDDNTVWLLLTKALYSGTVRGESAIMMLEGKIIEK